MRQSELARRAGLSQTTISDLERGRNSGTTELPAIAKALGTTADALAHGSPMQPSLTLTADQPELLRLWGLLSEKQRAEQIATLQEIAARNIDLVRQLGHLAPSIGQPVPDAQVARHLPPAPRGKKVTR